ncbi:hypothetical protein [Chroococcidiopsis sp. CCMEE 29]|uniref:hypothetical protein n=1 Tax=Chroococcidiopsis sp. CCMEE 29 TaxID=155894 RepID=UPI0020223848|nr:hypothetical protein [Chroococcidiopsis sp. CCMEE 29]
MADQVDYFYIITTSDPQRSKFEVKEYLQRFMRASMARETHKAMHGVYAITNPVPTPSGVVIKNVVTGMYRLVPRLKNPQGKYINGDGAMVNDFTTGDWKVVSVTGWEVNRPEDFAAAERVDANTGVNRWDG